MAREGLMDDSGYEFDEFECDAQSYRDCRECARQDLCSDYDLLRGNCDEADEHI